MAKAQILDIETGAAQKSLADLKREINELKNALYGLKEGTEEYDRAAQELGYAQEELREFNMRTREGINALAGSYNALSYEMSQLKVQWHATNDEAERNALAEQINTINDKLKAMDATVGNYQRNVGNYTNSMVDAFKQVGLTIGNISPLMSNLINGMVDASSKGKSAFSALGTSAKGLGAQLKSLAANPVGAAIMAVVIAVKALKAGFEKLKESVNRNEEASNNLKKAFAPIKAIINGITEVFDDLVEGLTEAAAAVGEFISAAAKMTGINADRVKDEEKIAEMEISNAKIKREYIVENSQLELEGSEARAKAAEKDKYTAEERIAYLQEYKDKQDKIAQNNVDMAQKELELLQLQAAQGKNDAEMNDRIAEAQANVNRAQQAYNDKLRETNAQMAEIRNSIKAEEEAQKKAAEEKAKKYREEIKKMTDSYKSMLKTFNDSLLGDDLDYKISELQKKQKEQVDELTKSYKRHAITKKQYDEAVYLSEAALYKQTQALRDAQDGAIDAFMAKYSKLISSDAANAVTDVLAAQAKEMEELQDALMSNLIDETAYYEMQEGINKAYAEKLSKTKNEQYVKAAQQEIALAQATQDAIYERDVQMNRNAYLTRQKDSESYLKAEFELEQAHNQQLIDQQVIYRDKIQNLYDTGQIDLATYTEQMVSIETQIAELTNFNLEMMDEQYAALVDKNVMLFTSLTDIMADFTTEISGIGDGISSEWSKVFSTLSAGVVTLGENLETSGKGWKTWAGVAQTALGTTTSFLTAMASEQDQSSREGFETAKKYNIAAAVVSMLNGIVGAWSSAMEYPFPYNVIIGGVLSTLIGTIGGIQIAKIKQTQYDSGSSSSSSSSSTSVTPNYSSLSEITTPVQYTSDVQGASYEDTVADTRVYVVESDIQETGSRVSVAESESRY